MTKGDFYGNEKSYIVPQATEVKIEHIDVAGKVTLLKQGLKLKESEIIDATFMSVKELKSFYETEIKNAKAEQMLLSLHLKATMMKVSDPIMFGHCVKVYFKEVFEKHADTIKTLKVNANNGLGDLYDKIKQLPEASRKAIEEDILKVYEYQPWLAMVNSSKGQNINITLYFSFNMLYFALFISFSLSNQYPGITNLHVPSDVIVDASMVS
jgi:isocitrate dehydrogenase